MPKGHSQHQIPCWREQFAQGNRQFAQSTKCTVQRCNSTGNCRSRGHANRVSELSLLSVSCPQSPDSLQNHCILVVSQAVMCMGTARPGPAQNTKLCAHGAHRGSRHDCAKKNSHGHSARSILQGRSWACRTGPAYCGQFFGHLFRPKHV